MACHIGMRKPAVSCPCCGGAATVYRSHKASDLSRQYSLVRCNNPLCGWSGSGVFEVTATISPPSKAFAKGCTLPEADEETLRRLSD